LLFTSVAYFCYRIHFGGGLKMSVSQPAAISQEEFQRLQTQLLDLRTANYTLMEESNRYKNGGFH